MAWGRNNSDPPPPRAFSGSAEANVRAAIVRAAAEQRWMITRDIEMHEILQLYIKPEHRDPLKLAFNEVEFNSIDQSLQVQVPIPLGLNPTPNQKPCVVYEWDWNTSKPDGFFVPKYAVNCTFQPDAPEELMEKHASINARLQKVSYDFGLVRHVFEGLNKNGFCNTPQQMRFVWPAIRHLVDRFDKKLGNSLVDASARAGDKARVPPDLVEYMVPTVNTMARSLLLTDVNMNEKRPLVVKMGSVHYHANGDNTFEGVI
jgi:hypothetical protein